MTTAPRPPVDGRSAAVGAPTPSSPRWAEGTRISAADAATAFPDPAQVPPLVVDLGGPRRVLSSAVLGGGLGMARTWLCVTVGNDYARLDPAADLADRAAALGLRGPVVGMLTGVDVRRVQRATCGRATVHATVGVGRAVAAAGDRPPDWGPAGTINILVSLDAGLTPSALVAALGTAVEAKTQALADAGIAARNAAGFATGTPTDAICIAAHSRDELPFAGTATAIGAEIAGAVHAAVLAGTIADRAAFAARSVRAPQEPGA